MKIGKWRYQLVLAIIVVIFIISAFSNIYLWKSNADSEKQLTERMNMCIADLQDIKQQKNEWMNLTNSKIMENQSLNTELEGCRKNPFESYVNLLKYKFVRIRI